MITTLIIVDVVLKPEILAPQECFIVGTLGDVGLLGIADVQQGKQFTFNIGRDVDETTLA